MMKRLMQTISRWCWVGLWAGAAGAAAATPPSEPSWRLWPEQRTPRTLVTLATADFPPAVEPGPQVRGSAAGAMLAQSVAGLSALAVNEGRSDELVYIEESPNAHYALWRERLLARTGLADGGSAQLWDLIARYRKRGLIDGYILYRYDSASVGSASICRPGMDESVNVATSLAGPLRGLLVSEGLEAQAQAAGLPRLLDVRGKDAAWAFATYRERFNRRGVLLQNPVMVYGRATAIAHRFFTCYGLGAPVEAVYAWMEKPGLVFGWNDGTKELESVLQISQYGHVLSPADWEYNLAPLSIGAATARVRPLRATAAPKSAPTAGPAVAFCMSDGDNLQWLLRDFVLNSNYWASPDHGSFPVGWGLPLADLLETGVDIYGRLQETQPARSGVFLMTEYFYPDYYGRRLPAAERQALLRQLGRRYERTLQQTGVNVMGLLVRALDTPGMQAALEALVSEMPSLQGLLVWPFDPYEGGNGQVLWLRRPSPAARAAGGLGPREELPAVFCKYSLWAQRQGPRAGTPAKLARLINADARQGGADYLAWAITHVWSGFQRHEGPDEQAENGQYLAPGTAAGVTPTRWCVERLDPGVQPVTPEELIRRLRQRHAPAP